MKKIWKRTWNKLGTLGMLLIGALILAVLSWYLLPGISETQQPEETQAAEVIRETVAAETPEASAIAFIVIDIAASPLIGDEDNI